MIIKPPYKKRTTVTDNSSDESSGSSSTIPNKDQHRCFATVHQLQQSDILNVKIHFVIYRYKTVVHSPHVSTGVVRLSIHTINTPIVKELQIKLPKQNIPGKNSCTASSIWQKIQRGYC